MRRGDVGKVVGGPSSTLPSTTPSGVFVAQFDTSLLRWRDDDDADVDEENCPHGDDVFHTPGGFPPASRTPEYDGREACTREEGRRDPRPFSPELPESVLASILRYVARLPGGGIPSVLAAGAVCRGEGRGGG